MKKIQIISIHEGYLTIIAKQLNLIFGDKAEISELLVKNLDTGIIAHDDIVILSRPILMGVARPFIPEMCTIIIGEREVNIANTKRLIQLPSNQKLLIVNDTLDNAQETLESLRNIFFDHHYIVDDPMEGSQLDREDIDYIVTPGEMEFVPSKYSNVIDIGPRVLSFNTISQIGEALKVNLTTEQIVNRYIKSQVSLSSDELPVMKDKIIHVENGLSRDYRFIDKKIEEHGFLRESLEILRAYDDGKDNLQAFGRLKLKKMLEKRQIFLSEQQIRLRLEILQELNLVHIRQGRSGTTITEVGEEYLKSKLMD